MTQVSHMGPEPGDSQALLVGPKNCAQSSSLSLPLGEVGVVCTSLDVTTLYGSRRITWRFCFFLTIFQGCHHLGSQWCV